MKAIVVERPGGIEALRCETVPDPTPSPRELVVQVARCGVCMHDIAVRNGTLRRGVRLPCILGHEIAGRVVAVGAEVTAVAPGERVATVQRAFICGQCRYCRSGWETLCPRARFLGDVGLVGGYAEYVAVSEDNVATVPDGVTDDQAAIAACTVGTIVNAVSNVGKIRPGERVLVTGASGGLGIHAVQVARLAGAEVVAVTTSPDKADQVRAAGANTVVVPRRGEDFSSAVLDATHGDGADVAIDTVGTPVFDAIRRSMALGGRWLLIGQVSGEFVRFNPAQLFLRGISMLSAVSTTREQLRTSMRLIDQGRITPVIEATMPLGHAAQAHSQVEQGRVLGRLLLAPGVAHPEPKRASQGETS
jgi:acryloyl-coenzyme A reductase